MVDTKTITELRTKTGAGIVDCKKALEESGGDVARAAELLRKQGMAKAGKRAERSTRQGLVHSYIHAGGQVGVLVEVQCETDFVARTDQFKEFAHDVALQIAATNPLYMVPEQIPPEVIEKEKEIAAEEFAGSGKSQDVIDKIVCGKLEKWYAEVCLMNQPFIKDEDKTMDELLKEIMAKTGEKVQITRFVRFGLGEGCPCC